MTASTVRNTAIFAIATLLSRVSGLVRDSMFAGYFGTSRQYDAYLVAVMLPFFLRKIFADGAMTMAFVPIFNDRLGRSRGAFEFASAVMIFVLLLSGLISAGGVFFASGGYIRRRVQRRYHRADISTDKDLLPLHNSGLLWAFIAAY